MKNKKINKINQQIKQWEEEKQYIIKQQEIKKQKQDLYKHKKLSTSKILTFFLFLNCTAIEIFTGWVTITNMQIARELMISPDLTPLLALIGAVVGETIGFAIYSIKAAKQNCVGGIVYEQALLKANNSILQQEEQYNI